MDVADMALPAALSPFVAAGAAFPAPFRAVTNPCTDLTIPDIFLKAKNPAATAGIKASIFSNGATLSSPKKST